MDLDCCFTIATFNFSSYVDTGYTETTVLLCLAEIVVGLIIVREAR